MELPTVERKKILRYTGGLWGFALTMLRSGGVSFPSP